MTAHPLWKLVRILKNFAGELTPTESRGDDLNRPAEAAPLAAAQAGQPPAVTAPPDAKMPAHVLAAVTGGGGSPASPALPAGGLLAAHASTSKESHQPGLAAENSTSVASVYMHLPLVSVMLLAPMPEVDPQRYLKSFASPEAG